MTEPAKQPTIADAKAIATKYRKSGVIVFHFDGKQFGFSSYGWTRPLCDQMGKVANRFMDFLQKEGMP